MERFIGSSPIVGSKIKGPDPGARVAQGRGMIPQGCCHKE
jgi:hypothetical protein